MDERKLADHLISKHSTRDPFKIAAAMGRIIIQAPLLHTRGFYQYYKRQHIIYLDDGLDPFEQNYVCAHELGHSIYHRAANAIFLDHKTRLTTSKYERSADRFAISLIVSDDMINDLTNVCFHDLSLRWKVRPEIIAYRFTQL